MIFSLVEQVIKVKETRKFDIGIKRWSASIEEAIADPETVVIGLQNYLHSQAVVFHGYLEDLVYTPKTLKALQARK